MKRYLFLALIALGCLFPAAAQVIDCPSGVSSSRSCGVALIGAGRQPLGVFRTTNGTTPAFNGLQIDLISTGATTAATASDAAVIAVECR
jgi:hypothetical protein